ncbi:MAG: TonB-dependent receptor [Bacteroidetes bacterium]|nr:TonB-dependent receptor [Bacteroidota bacterium]
MLYKFNSKLQARISRSSGFRAPQAFDTDMHIAFSGGGVALTAIDPQLQPEYSTSYSFSADYNVPRQKYIYGFTVAAFYTQIRNTFILEEQPAEPNSTNTILFRTNGSNATVKGITLETRFNFNYKVEAEFGFTFQESQYEQAVTWSAEIPGIKQFLRTPSSYGYFASTFRLTRDLKYSLSGVFTGPMNIAHFAGAPGVDQDELIQSNSFLELNTKLEYALPLHIKQFQMTASGGIQNLLDAFQNDFDSGPYRDSNYIYGPGRPRTLFFSLKIEMNGRSK